MQKPLQQKFSSGLVWNYGSVAFLALGGFIFSFIIIAFYDAAVLGAFNQVYAYYLLFSQVAVLGVHMSVTKYTSDAVGLGQDARPALGSALLLVVGISLLTDGLIAAVLALAGQWIPANLLPGLWSLLPALPFFSMNKVILGYVNGRSEMRAYAVLQSLRNIFIAVALLVLALVGTPGALVCLCFAIAEFALFLVSAGYLLARRQLAFTTASLGVWMKRHLHFGVRILPGNLVLEFNSKIDIICLGWVLGNDTIVGYYSFASLFTEGFYQLFVVMRRSINPLLAQYNVAGRMKASFEALRDRLRRPLWILSLPAAAVLCVAYYLLCILMGRQGYEQATLPLAVIVASIALNSRSIVFGNLLAQTGYPTQESIVNVAAATTNLLLNLVLIYFFGMLGAAVATGVSYFVFNGLLRLFSWQKLKLRI